MKAILEEGALEAGRCPPNVAAELEGDKGLLQQKGKPKPVGYDDLRINQDNLEEEDFQAQKAKNKSESFQLKWMGYLEY